MEKHAPVNRLATFLVIFLLVMLPVSVSAQVASATQASSTSASPEAAPSEAVDYAESYGYLSQGDAEAELFCSPGNVNCWKFLGWCKKQWECNSAIWCGLGYKHCGSSGETPNCKDGSLVCCPSGYPKLCGSYCWDDCANDQYKTYNFACENSKGVCKVASCIHPTWPFKCGNECWTSCGSGYVDICGSDGIPKCVSKCVDSDGDGYGSGCSKGSDCNDNNVNINPGKSETCNSVDDNCNGQIDEGVKNACGGCGNVPSEACGDGKDNDCDGLVDEGCCTDKDGDGYGSGCSKGSDCNDNNANVNPGRSESCNNVDDDCDGSVDEGISQSQSCGVGICAGGTQTKFCSLGQWGNWGSCSTSGKATSEICGDGKDNDCDGLVDEGCCPADKPYSWGGACNKCPSSSPYYCTRTGGSCLKNSAECSNAQKCGSEGWTLCRDPKWPYWNCGSDGKSGCCPTGYPYLWNSDKQCHTSSEPKKCAVPDGSSANCDCNTDADCAKVSSSKPFCGEAYGKREGSGFHACLSSKPEYCGNGKCGSGEDYKNCASDCAAPKGTISVDVVYSSGAQANKPISGAYVYLDGAQKGTTGSDGKVSFEASYGSRNVKVDCPEKTFCDLATVGVSGTAYKSFKCPCNPPGDSDNDGYSDDDERLLGTDPNDAGSNFAVATGLNFMDTTGGCLTKIAQVVVDWLGGKSKDDLIQAHNSVVSALNVPQVTAVSVEEKPYVITAALASASIEGEIITGTNMTFEKALKNADYADGIITSGELLIIATDVETGTTAIIAASGRCLGVLTGLLYGAGNAVVDDVKGLLIDLPTLIGQILGAIGNAIWFVTVNTVTGNLKKVENSITGGIGGLVGDVTGIYKNSNDIFSSAVRSMVKGILENGRGVNIFSEGRSYNKDAYLDFQIGFFNGYIGGWIMAQIGLLFVGVAEIKALVTAVKSGKIAKLFGKALELPESLAKLAKQFGDKAVEGIAKLKYADNVVKWTEAEQKGLARIFKHNEEWAKGLSEAEAKVAAKHADDLVAAGKVSDAAFADLAKTKLGQHTLKSADATTDLLAKQSKLVQKWGVKKADDVVSKGGRVVERTTDLNKVLKAMPGNIADGFDADRAVKFLGNKDVIKGTEVLAKNFDSQTLSSLVKSADEFEDLTRGASRVNEKFGSLDNFYPALKKCVSGLGISTASACSPEEYVTLVENLKSLGVHTGKIFIKYGKDGLDMVLIGTKRLQSSGLVFNKLPFSDADKIRFLKDLGEAETAFGVSEKGLKKIEFVDDIRKINPAASEDAVGLWDFDALGNPTIYISETASKKVGPNIMKYPLFHEYGHAKMFDLGVDINKLVKSVPKNKIGKSITPYDEFLTDILAAEKFGEKASSHIFLLQDAEMLRDFWNLFDFAEIARRRAIAIKLGRSDITKEIDDVIKSKPNFNKIKSLSEKFAKNSDFLAKSAGEQAKIADDIAKETLELLEGS